MEKRLSRVRVSTLVKSVPSLVVLFVYVILENVRVDKLKELAMLSVLS